MLLIISLFIKWIGAGDFGASGWETFSFDDIALFVLGVLAIALAAIEATGSRANLPVERPRALTTVGIIATTIVLAANCPNSFGSDRPLPNSAAGVWSKYLLSSDAAVGPSGARREKP